jgi:hypothetical protein
MSLRPQSADSRFNATAQDLNSKSMLQSRTDNRMTGSKFFDGNKVRTGTHIIQNGTHFSVVPFYDKRNTK